MGKDIQDLASLIDKLDLGPVHLVGHSWGAFVCLWLSIRRPELVRSLVLAEPPFLPLFVSSPPKPQELIRMFAISPATAMAVLKFGMRGFATPTSVVKRDGALMFARSPMGMPMGQNHDAAAPQPVSRAVRPLSGSGRAAGPRPRWRPPGRPPARPRLKVGSSPLSLPSAARGEG